MGNLSGVLGIFRACRRPGLLIPDFQVRDVRALNFPKLKGKGVTGVVFDKDNCLTRPHSEELFPPLQAAWSSCVSTFGPKNVLIVSNSAGTLDDPGGVQAQILSRRLGVPILLHSTKKPGCWRDVAGYFASLEQATTSKTSKPPNALVASLPANETPDSQHSPLSTGSRGSNILVVGDRVMTDVMLGNLLRRRGSALSVYTQPICKEGLGTVIMRRLEDSALQCSRWLVQKGWARRPTPLGCDAEWASCVHTEVAQKRPQVPVNASATVWVLVRHPLLVIRSFASSTVLFVRIKTLRGFEQSLEWLKGRLAEKGRVNFMLRASLTHRALGITSHIEALKIWGDLSLVAKVDDLSKRPILIPVFHAARKLLLQLKPAK